MNRAARSVLALGLTSVGLVAIVPAATAVPLNAGLGVNAPAGLASATETPKASGGLLTSSVGTSTRSADTTGASTGGPLLKPTNPKCVKRKTEKKRLCGGPFRDRARTSWWSKPPEYRVVDVSIIGTTKMEALAEDDGMRFNGEGEVWLSARKGFSGTFKLPKAGKTGIGIGTLTAKSVDWTSRSTGAWISSVGDEYGCGVTLENGPLAPTGLGAMIGTNPRKDEISINWNLGGPAYKCPKDLVDGPPFDEKFNDSSLIRYRASSFRGHKLVRLPVTSKWSNTSETTRTTVEWSGHVLLQRVP